MPTYRYRCSTCGDESEVWQSIKDDPLTVHEGCGGDLVKVLSAAGIVLKGSGFYKTDNRSSNGRGSSTSEKSDSKSGSTSDSKSGSGSSSEKSSSSSSEKSSSSAPKSSDTSSTSGSSKS